MFDEHCIQSIQPERIQFETTIDKYLQCKRFEKKKKKKYAANESVEVLSLSLIIN